jgi:hypothetical protein
MLTEHEAHELYVEILAKLRRLGAEDLAREIELTVLRGALRTESGPGAKGQVFQTPLSSKEALLVALRMFLAAVEPAFQIPHMRDVLAASEDGDEDEPVVVSWAFDRLQATEDDDLRRSSQPDPDAVGELEDLSAAEPVDLARLREMVKRLAALVQELEAEEG